MSVYDPPEGWRYGFPKSYKPLIGEKLEDTLRRDGYPEELLAQGMAKYVRFWGLPTDREHTQSLQSLIDGEIPNHLIEGASGAVAE